MSNIAAAIAEVRSRIIAAERAYGRKPASVRLIAVSKTQPAAALRSAFLAGQHAFGENYLQEALTKLDALEDLALEWHFIGPIQANKTKIIAERFAWVHSVDRIKLLKRLSEQRPADAQPLNVCLQVNIDREPTKAGVTPQELPALAAAAAELPGLRLRGLMAIPAPRTQFNEQRQVFAAVAALAEELTNRGHALDTLSMGMTDDLEAAIAAGSTLVRVGSAIFGARG